MIVLDASLMVAWLLEEEAVASAPELDDLLEREALIVPAHWVAEIGNALLINRRRGRIPADRFEMIMEDCATFDIQIEPAIEVETLGAIIDFALSQNLTVYDAAYLQIALQHNATLATLDQAMRTSAAKLNIPLLPA